MHHKILIECSSRYNHEEILDALQYLFKEQRHINLQIKRIQVTQID